MDICVCVCVSESVHMDVPTTYFCQRIYLVLETKGADFDKFYLDGSSFSKLRIDSILALIGPVLSELF